ncbi:MAG TPA: hypothetical protein VMU84_14620 [Thermoanaerobaculia bacterium]|nr:hypothetical protein [Thermoanaerobaculia bacterium]
MPRANVITVTGTLEELNARDGVTGVVREADGTEWKCTFSVSDPARLRTAWLRTVHVTGTSSDHHLLVDDVLQADDFWRSKTLDELAHEQGIKPGATLDDVPKLFESKAEADEFLHWILEERHARRGTE